MHNPYFQVARTYLERPVLSLQRPAFVLILFVCFITFIGYIKLNKYISSLLLIFLFLFSYWAIHVKEQFADSRASLTPDFRKIHGVVAVTTGIVLVIILPGVTALLSGKQPIGAVSITMFLFGIIVWAILRLGKTFFPLIWAGFMSTAFVPVQSGIEQIVLGKKPIQAFIIMGVGVILSITAIIRLFLLKEEKPEYCYLRSLKFSIDGQTKLSDLQLQKLKKTYSRGLRGWLTSITAVRMIYHARHAADSYWSRIQRWNNYHGSAWSALLPAVVLNLFTTLDCFFSGRTPFSEARIGLPTVLPVLLVIAQFNINKSRLMAYDLMMPVKRDSYLKELGCSLALNLFFMWAVMISVSVAWMFTVDPKPNPEFLIYAVPYSAMIQIWFFGLAVWVHSFRLNIMTFLTIIIAAVLSMMSCSALGKVMLMWLPIFPGAPLMCLGLLFVRLGYCRWLVAEFNSEQRL